jgi:hypothetical protein
MINRLIATQGSVFVANDNIAQLFVIALLTVGRAKGHQTQNRFSHYPCAERWRKDNHKMDACN